jgi:hypothetical protein
MSVPQVHRFGSDERIYEKLLWIQPDGIPFDLSDGYRFKWLHHEGFGINPMNLQQVRVPGQHGALWRGVIYQEKTVGIEILLRAPSLASLETRRADLFWALTPSRGIGRLQVSQSNGRTYFLDCVLAEELPLPSTDNIGLHHHRTNLRFVSTGLPFWQDGAEGIVAHYPTTHIPEPFFPFSFPMKLGQSGIWKQLYADVQGHVAAPAYIKLTGPAASPIFTNERTGERISIPSLVLTTPGDVLEIQTNPLQRSVKVNGVRDWSKIRSAQFFQMLPGPNTITIDIGLADNRTGVEIRWPNYYLGI